MGGRAMPVGAALGPKGCGGRGRATDGSGAKGEARRGAASSVLSFGGAGFGI